MNGRDRTGRARWEGGGGGWQRGGGRGIGGIAWDPYALTPEGQIEAMQRAMKEYAGIKDLSLIDPSVYQMDWGELQPLGWEQLQKQLFEAMWPEAKEAFLGQQAAMGKLPSGQTDIGLGNLTAQLMAQAALPGFQAQEGRVGQQMGIMGALQQMMAGHTYDEAMSRLMRQWQIEDIRRAKKEAGGFDWGPLFSLGFGKLGEAIWQGFNPLSATGQLMPWELDPQKYGMQGPPTPGGWTGGG